MNHTLDTSTLKSLFGTLVALSLALCALTPSLVAAQDAPPAPQKTTQGPLQVEIKIIQIRTDEVSFDPALEPLKDKLHEAFTGYTSFKSLSSEKATIAKDQSHMFSLPDNTPLTISHQDEMGDVIRLGVSVGDKVKTGIKVSRDHTFFQAGLPYKEGILVIAITAR